MCTTSWALQSEGYHFFFTRDESRKRVPGTPPEITESATGVKRLHPTDPKGGGTWIFVNEFGLTGCILNHYAADTRDVPDAASRGQLLLALATSPSATVFAELAREQISQNAFRPFILLAITPGGKPSQLVWNGDSLEILPAISPPVTTSSFQTERVLAARRSHFPETASRESLLAYHCDEDNQPGADTVRMSRPDSHTVSLTEISVGAGTAAMTYAARDGDRGFLPGVTLELPLRP